MGKTQTGKKVLLYLLISIIVLVLMTPYTWMVINTFRGSTNTFGSSILPTKWTLENYSNVFRNTTNLKAILNSLFCSTVAALLTLLLATCTAYGISRYRFKGRSLIMSIFLCLRTFPVLLLAIAMFAVVVKNGLYNSYIPIILANTMLNLPFAVWNCISVIDAVPVQIEESGLVDGLTPVGAIVRLTLPMARPGLVSTFTYIFIMAWNEYLFAMTFINDTAKQLITTRIAANISQFSVDYAGLLTTSVIASLPIIVLFVFIQRNIISGITMGGVKE